MALAFPIGPSNLNAVTRGVTDYAGKHGGWLLTTNGESADLPIQSLRRWKGDGILSILTSEADARAARRLLARGMPVVTFSGALRRPGVPRVRVDNAAVGALAAEHLLGRGYERFAFYGLEEVAYSRERGESFVSRVEKGGGKCARLLSPNTFHAGRLGEHELQAVDAWLKHLRRPVGIFAVNDYRAQLLANACRLQALRVPRDVGIVGVDNNHVICEFTSPTLTSVDCDWYQVGYRAAELLDRLMKERGRRRGKMRSEEGAAKTPLEDLLVPPAGIVQRISTDLRVVEDRRLWTSLDYIRDHLGEVFGVERIIAVSGISRRTLEMVFFTELGCSPYHYLCGQRVERAKGLLAAEKEMRLQEISSRCGFHDLRRFREVFRRMEGISPAEFRARPPETGRRQGG